MLSDFIILPADNNTDNSGGEWSARTLGRGAPQCYQAPLLRHLRKADRCAPYLPESVYKVVLQKSIPAQISQRILLISCNKDKFTDF